VLARIFNAIRRLLDVRAGEGFAVLYCLAYVALAVGTFLLAKPIRNALFLSEYGAYNLVYVYVAVPVVLTLLLRAFNRVAARSSARGVLTGSLVFLMLNVIAFWYGFTFHRAPWLSAALYVWVNCYGVIAPVQAWTFANAVFDTRQARRLFGLIASGASFGAIVGGLLAQQLAPLIGTVHLLLVLAGMIGLMALLVNVGWRIRRFDRGERTGGVERTLSERASDRGGARVSLSDTWRQIWHTPYLRQIATMVFLVAIVTQWTQFQFSLAAELRYAGDPDRLTRFFGSFNFYLGLVSLAVQLFLTGPALREFGVAVTILLLPLSLGFGSLMIAVFPALWAVLLTNSLDQSLRFSVDKATFELLYLPLPVRMKQMAKGVIDLLVNRVADGVGGVLLGLATQGFSLIVFTLPGAHLGLRGLAIVNLFFIGIWISVALALRRGYVEAIKDSILRHRLDVERQSARGLERSAARVLAGTFDAEDADKILYALDMFQAERRHVPHPALKSLLGHPSPRVRSRALSWLNEAGDLSVLPQVEELLRDADLEVRTEALLYLAYHTRIDPLARIRELGDFSDFSIQAGLIAFLSRPGTMQNLDAARVLVDAMVREQGPQAPRVRMEAARLLGMLPNEFSSSLVRLLSDPDRDVVRRALEAAGRLKALDLLDLMLPHLPEPELKTSTLDAIVALGPDALDGLAEHLADEQRRPEIRREIPLVIAYIGTSLGRQILTDHLLEQDVILRYRVIAALNKLHQIHPEIEMDREAIEMVLTAEIMGLYRSYQILGSLGNAFEAGDPVSGALDEAMEHEGERIFRLLSLRWPEFDMHSAYVGLRSDNTSIRANALEFLENILKPQLRHLIVPLFDSQVTVEERVRRATQLLGSSVDTHEQAVAVLLASDDPWLRACGVYAVGLLRLTSLAPQLDRLADTKDPLLRETIRATRLRLLGKGPQIGSEEPVLTEDDAPWQGQERSMGM